MAIWWHADILIEMAPGTLILPIQKTKKGMKTMRRRYAVYTLLAFSLGTAPVLAQTSEQATGIVFEDLNENGQFDEGIDQPMEGVVVADEEDFSTTGPDGRFEIPVDDDSIIFVVKPKGYAVPVDENNLPRFYYIHKPQGSPESYYDGVAATGDLPDQIEFPLYPVEEPEAFRVALLADTQPESSQEVDYIRDDVLSELPLMNPDFAIVLGDIMFDHLNLFDRYIRSVGKVGVPFYHVLGNHDLNFDAPDDEHSDETFNRYFGPANYTFNYGKAHFVVFDNIRWLGGKERTGTYDETFEPWQIDWLERNLEYVPEDRLIVIGTHAPLWSATRRNKLTGNIQALFDVLKDRKWIVAVSGHTHYNNHHFFTEEEGWEGDGEFHSHNTVTVSGSWWSGPKDARGIPLADQRDGSPNGYTILAINGTDYTFEYKAAGMDKDFQMRIYPPEQQFGDSEKLLANIFDGMPGAEVMYRINGSEWSEMDFAPQEDPMAQALYSGPMDSGKSWVNPAESHHIWEADLSGREDGRGPYFVEIRYSDRLDRVIEGSLLYNP